LRALLPTFCVLAPQAKSVRLAGLEDLTADPTAQAELTNLVLGKSLVGQVHLKDNSGISMILYVLVIQKKMSTSTKKFWKNSDSKPRKPMECLLVLRTQALRLPHWKYQKSL